MTHISSARCHLLNLQLLHIFLLFVSLARYIIAPLRYPITPNDVQGVNIFSPRRTSRYAEMSVTIELILDPTWNWTHSFSNREWRPGLALFKVIFRSIRDLIFTSRTGREWSKIFLVIRGQESVYKWLPKFDQLNSILELFITFGNGIGKYF